MRLEDADDLAKGIVAGLISEQVNTKGRFLSRLALVVAAVAAVAAVFAGGWLRWALVALAVAACVGSVFVFVVRKLADRAIHLFAPPQELGDYRGQIAKAVDAADLPSGPVSGLRLLWRLRKGASAEVKRVKKIVSSLATEINADPTP